MSSATESIDGTYRAVVPELPVVAVRFNAPEDHFIAVCDSAYYSACCSINSSIEALVHTFFDPQDILMFHCFYVYAA